MQGNWQSHWNKIIYDINKEYKGSLRVGDYTVYLEKVFFLFRT